MTTTKDFPPGWAGAELGAVTTKPQYGWTTKATSSGNKLKLLRTSDISSGRVNWSTVPTCVDEPESPEKYYLNNGDIVVARAGSVGKSFLIREDVTDAVFASYLVRFTPRIDSKYVNFFMQSRRYWEQIEDKSAGIAIPNVNASKLAQIELPIAPLEEQHRIVEKIETLFTQLDQGEASLRSVQTLLSRYRQSVLKAAVTGQLTADWRAENSQRLEHGRDLLQRILQSRRDNWQGRGKYKEPAAPDTSDLPELPEGWVWASVEQLTSSEPNSLCIGPFGSNLKVDDYKETGVPLIFVRHIRSKNFEGMNPKFVSPEKADELSSHRAFPGDLLITKMGEPPGDVCIYPKGRPIAIITADCIRLAPASIGLSAEYLELAIASRIVQSQIHAISKGVAQQKVNLANFRKVAIPLPPHKEQLLIAESIKLNFEHAVQCQRYCETELTRSTALRQSILKDAFAGRLVPQDPNDEPAAALLARIRAERDAATKPAARGRGKAGSANAVSQHAKGAR